MKIKQIKSRKCIDIIKKRDDYRDNKKLFRDYILQDDYMKIYWLYKATSREDYLYYAWNYSSHGYLGTRIFNRKYFVRVLSMI